jgi:glycogen debranching enzyme
VTCSDPAGFTPTPGWNWNVFHRVEAERGLPAVEDYHQPGSIICAIVPDRSLLFRFSTQPDGAAFAGALERAESAARACLPATPPPTTKKPQEPAGGLVQIGSLPRRAAAPAGLDVEGALRLAASQFLVKGSGRDQTVIAGYHWFSDWGRDTMISLPGLCLSTGRLNMARAILRTFAGAIDRGLLPNLFLESGPGQYNTVDATLWFFHAVDRYLREADDAQFLHEIYPALESVVDWHLKGTQFNIKVDPADGLLSAGADGVALTWMDARVGDWVVTPRRGKPVEINALWFNAICLMSAWARELQRPGQDYAGLASQIGASFRKRFWNPAGGYLFDVIDGPDGDDASFRPNQIFAVSLPFAPVFGERAKAIVDAVRARLLTPFGLRTLAPDDPRYVARYEGDPRQRDGAYHQGTVWPWLIGPFIDAYLRMYNDPEGAQAMLARLLDHVARDGCIGTINEIFDAEEPFAPRGCVAQAWSVAEVFRQWRALYQPPPPKTTPTILGGGRHASH